MHGPSKSALAEGAIVEICSLSRSVLAVKDHAHACIQSLRGVRMTDSEGLWPQLIHCASHLSTMPLISDKVQKGPNEVWRILEADNSGGVSKGLPDECGKLLDKYWKLG
jgi:hypothetical protein